jgi:hypothetical protein
VNDVDDPQEELPRRKWQTPTLTEGEVFDVTQFTQNRPVDDGVRQFGAQYATYGS